jgi:hypothetical protein
MALRCYTHCINSLYARGVQGDIWVLQSSQSSLASHSYLHCIGVAIDTASVKPRRSFNIHNATCYCNDEARRVVTHHI